jgi:hypothetical protein
MHAPQPRASTQAGLVSLMTTLIKCSPCVHNDSSRRGSVYSSVILYELRKFLHSTHRGPIVHALSSHRPSPPVLHSSPCATGDMARTGSTSLNNNRVNRPSHQNATQRVRTYSQTQSRRSSMYRASIHSSSTTLHLSWLLRSNLPPRRGMPLPGDVQKRHFFGVGEIIGVLANVCDPVNWFCILVHLIRSCSQQKHFAPSRSRSDY